AAGYPPPRAFASGGEGRRRRRRGGGSFFFARKAMPPTPDPSPPLRFAPRGEGSPQRLILGQTLRHAVPGTRSSHPDIVDQPRRAELGCDQEADGAVLDRPDRLERFGVARFEIVEHE